MQGPTLFSDDNLKKINKIKEKSKEDVRLSNLTASHLLALAEVLKVSKSVKFLTLTITADKESFPEQELKTVFDAIQTNSESKIIAIHFRMSENFGDVGAKLLADFIRHNNKIISADLTRTDIGVTGVAALADALKVNSSMTSINLSWNDFEDQGLMHIIDLCKVNQTLEFVVWIKTWPSLMQALHN